MRDSALPAAEVAPGDPASPVDYAALYDAHPDYVARRASGSLEQAQIDIEVHQFKLPQLMAVLPSGWAPRRVLEIGCATGELIAAVPLAEGAQRVGIDISAANVAAARARFGHVEFRCGDFRDLPAQSFDAVILSDVLEHVPDDVGFLRDAAALGDVVLLNLPLEDNWLNRRRRYGPHDVSGHLRRYSRAQGLELVERAGLSVVAQRTVWFHETGAEVARRELRRQRLGQAYAGGFLGRRLRQALFRAAAAWRPLGRRLFASNLFVAARPIGAGPAAVPGRHGSPGAAP